jgi:hypothetical protein
MSNPLADIIAGMAMPSIPTVRAYASTREYLPDLKSFRPAALGIAEANYASEFYSQIQAYIEEFEARLDPEHDVGVYLVPSRGDEKFYLESMGFSNPSLISFNGHNADGQPITQIMHVTQINLPLTTMPRKNPDEPRRPIGFQALPPEA